MDDNSLMPFGKHKGKKMSEVPHGWFIYLYDRGLLRGDIKTYAETNVPILKVHARLKS